VVRTQMGRATLLLLLVLAFASGSHRAGSQGATLQKDLPQGANYLPLGEAREVILQGCVQCHDLQNTVSQRKNAAGWRRTVSEMIWRGAPLTADEAEMVTRYLVVSFGPEKPLPEALKTKSLKSDR